jgi:hypothetical protein
MSEDFSRQITLTPTIYKILKEKAQIGRYSTRVYLDILLHEVLAEDMRRVENKNNDLF